MTTIQAIHLLTDHQLKIRIETNPDNFTAEIEVSSGEEFTHKETVHFEQLFDGVIADKAVGCALKVGEQIEAKLNTKK